MFDHADGAFDIGAAVLDRTKPLRDRSSACGLANPDATRPWVVSVLQVGCWGYGPTNIQAASLLVPVDPSTVNFPDLVVGSCEGKPGYSCLLEDGAFGTCDGECRRRCVDAHDCLPPLPTRPDPDASVADAAPVEAAPDASAPSSRCKLIPQQPHFGVCVSACSDQR
jgi:hypothetical protein